MFKSVLRLSLTLVILLGLGGIAFICLVSFSLASPQAGPSQPSQLKPVVIKDYNLRSELDKEHSQRVEAKKTALKKQINSLKNQEEILENQKSELENNINKELDKIKEGYRQKLAHYQGIIDNEFRIYRESKEQEYKEKALLKKELSENRLAAMLKQLGQDQNKKLSLYITEERDKFYRATLNYRLNLMVLELSEEEKSWNEGKIKGIEQEYQGIIAKKKAEIEEESKGKLAELQAQFNQEYLQYQQQLTEEVNQDLKRRAAIDQQKIQDYLVEQQEMLGQELRQKSKELRQRSELELSRLKNLIGNIRTGYYLLESELAILEKEGIN